MMNDVVKFYKFPEGSFIKEFFERWADEAGHSKNSMKSDPLSAFLGQQKEQPKGPPEMPYVPRNKFVDRENDQIIYQLSVPGISRDEMTITEGEKAGTRVLEMTFDKSIENPYNAADDAEQKTREFEIEPTVKSATIQIDDETDIDEVTAQLDQGILTITVPKQIKSSKDPPEEIDIE